MLADLAKLGAHTGGNAGSACIDNKGGWTSCGPAPRCGREWGEPLLECAACAEERKVDAKDTGDGTWSAPPPVAEGRSRHMHSYKLGVGLRQRIEAGTLLS